MPKRDLRVKPWQRSITLRAMEVLTAMAQGECLYRPSQGFYSLTRVNTRYVGVTRRTSNRVIRQLLEQKLIEDVSISGMQRFQITGCGRAFAAGEVCIHDDQKD